LGMHMMATIDLSGIVSMIGIILKVAAGLGAVIFVHELGHFLVAKACGVKVEKFMIGFDIGGYKVSWRHGETVYGIGILPLGGYVKMLGQDDDPAHIKEQMEKSQVDVQSANAKAITGPDGETYYVDRRSYLAKSVPQRMAIISAGVIMNVIFAFIFAVIAYGMGVPYIPAVVSEVVPGSPAWEANIRPGDEIEQIGNRINPTFIQLKTSVTLGDLEKGIELRVRRAADGKVVTVPLKPQQLSGKLATIGLAMPFSLVLFDEPVFESSVASSAKLINPPAGKLPEDQAKLLAGDEIVRVGDVAIKDYPAFAALLAQQPEKALQITVRRERPQEVNAGAKNDSKPAETQELTFEVQPQHVNRFGLSMKMGPIVSVRPESPAAAAGIVVGDLIELVDGKKLGEGASPAEAWDAETLSNYLRRAAAAGHDVELTVKRGAEGGEEKEAKIRVKPELPTMMNMPGRVPGTPMPANEIGIAYRIQNEVALVPPNSPGAGKIAPGDKTLQAKITFPEVKDLPTPEPVVVKFVPDEPNWFGRLWLKIFGGATTEPERFDWPRLLDLVQFVRPDTEVELTVKQGDSEPRTVKLAPIVDDSAFIPARGFALKPVERIRKADSFAEQVRYGGDETFDALSMVFRFLKKIGSSQVPVSALGGPVSIAKAAGYSAAEGIPTLLMFLTMLSANLAVLNLLPIPLLDGGHLVFLAYEGIRGRPANERFVVALHTVGFVFIVSLMLYVLALDLHIIPRNL
jgi:regulator of sigma E protease